MRDMHIHTEFSCDSDAKMKDNIEKAKTSGIGTICFTDHVDMNTNNYGYNYYCADGFWRQFNEIKSNVDVPVEILAGIEFGEPHLYEKCLKDLTKYPYDFVIGSIH